MRLYLLTLCAGLSLTVYSQRSNLIITGNMVTASGVQTGKLKNGYGIGTGLELPIMKSPLKWTLGFNMNINGMTNMPYEFYYQNNYTKTEINMTAYLFDFTTGLRYVFNEDKMISPYVGINGGALKYHSEMIIEDPEDPDGCHALESENISSSVSYIARVETGIRITPKSSGCNSSFEIGFGYTRGTEGEYVKLMNDGTSSPGGMNYMVKFQSPNSEVHEHSIGKIYKTGTNQLAFHIGWIVPL